MTQACYLDAETARELSDVVKPIDDNAVSWQDACAQRQATACTDFVMDTKGFRGVSTGDRERLVYFSVPNDNGWKAYVNGEETRIYTVNGGMMGVVVPEGTSEIEFEFVTPGLFAGGLVSIASFVAIFAYGIVDFVIKKKKKS